MFLKLLLQSAGVVIDTKLFSRAKETTKAKKSTDRKLDVKHDKAVKDLKIHWSKLFEIVNGKTSQRLFNIYKELQGY